MTVRAALTGLLLAGGMAFGQSCPAGQTLVRDTVAAPAALANVPRLMFGKVTVKPVGLPSLNGQAFGQMATVVQVSKGAFAACFVPGRYGVHFEHSDAQGAAVWDEAWSVPVSTATLAIAALRTATPLTALPTAGAQGSCYQTLVTAGWYPCAPAGWLQLPAMWSAVSATTWNQMGWGAQNPPRGSRWEQATIPWTGTTPAVRWNQL